MDGVQSSPTLSACRSQRVGLAGKPFPHLTLIGNCTFREIGGTRKSATSNGKTHWRWNSSTNAQLVCCNF